MSAPSGTIPTESKAFRTTERICSALACNCMQLSCCLPHNYVKSAVVASSSSFDCSNWMQQLAQDDSNAQQIKLRDCVIPGTHDSCSYTISGWKPFSAVGQTQILNVVDQLNAGARYLDVRFAGASSGANGNNGLSIWHGGLEGGNLKDILEQIADFLKQHSGEFLLLEMVAEYGRPFSAAQKEEALQLIKDTFGDLIFSGKDMKSLLNTTTLAELNQQKKQVLVLLHNRFYENNYEDKSEQDILNEFGFVTSQKWMRNRWHNTRDNVQLLECNLRELDRCRGNNKQFLNSQFVLTPGVGGASDVVAALTGQNSLQPIVLASRLYRPSVLDDFLRQNADKGWNILMLDFIDRCPMIVAFAISLNFATNLDIQLAVVSSSASKSTDVTDKIRSFVYRQRVLFLSQMGKDLELPDDDGTLTLACQLGDSCMVVTIDFDMYTQLIVSKFACNDNADKVTLDDKDPAGFVGHGQVHAQRDGFAGESGPILEYKREGIVYEFKVVE